jgi:hypothetical protein
MNKFEEFIEAVLKGSIELAQPLFDALKENVESDTIAFLEKTRVDLVRWTTLLADGKITERDFSDFVHAKQALAEIHALTAAGVTLTQLERFRSGLIDLVISTAFKIFL